MAEFLLELFSEEIPANLQSTARINLLKSFKRFFEKENIIFKDGGKIFSTPNRLVLCFKKIEKEIYQRSEEIRGPNVKAPDKAVEGFLKSNLIQKKDIYKKILIKVSFFFKKTIKKDKVQDVLKTIFQIY
jgi:Glycyl-tRNA synthetase, beta subunit